MPFRLMLTIYINNLTTPKSEFKKYLISYYIKLSKIIEQKDLF